MSGDGTGMDAAPGAEGAPGSESSAVVLAGRYEVGTLVGLGSSARVHRAWDRDRGHAVAVKIFEPGGVPAPGRGGAWELEVVTGLRHPGLVHVHDSGVDAQGCMYVVMDLVDGGTLGARLREGPLPAPAVARLGAEIAEALADVHACGVVHRDVKPGNLLLDAEGRPRLTDFGISRIVGATRVTGTGVAVGTAAYMAPEQVRGETVGPAADVYALGLVLLEAVTGRREYEGGALESALARLHRAPRVPAQVPDPLAAALRRMTAFEPSARPSASDVAAALDPQPAPDPGRGYPAGGRRRVARLGRRLAPVGALACLVAAALTGSVLVIGAEPGPPTSAGVSSPPVPPRAPRVAPTGAAPIGVPPQAPAPELHADAGSDGAGPVAVPPRQSAAQPVAVRPPEPGIAPGQPVGLRSRSSGSGPRHPTDTHAETTADNDSGNANRSKKRVKDSASGKGKGDGKGKGRVEAKRDKGKSNSKGKGG